MTTKKKNNYCDIQKECKLLKSANSDYEKICNQYNQVILQNQGLQGELRQLQENYNQLEQDLLITEDLNTALQLKIRELETDALSLLKEKDILEEFIKKPKVSITHKLQEQGSLYSATIEAPFGLWTLKADYFQQYYETRIKDDKYRKLLLKSNILSAIVRAIAEKVEETINIDEVENV